MDNNEANSSPQPFKSYRIFSSLRCALGASYRFDLTSPRFVQGPAVREAAEAAEAWVLHRHSDYFNKVDHGANTGSWRNLQYVKCVQDHEWASRVGHDHRTLQEDMKDDCQNSVDMVPIEVRHSPSCQACFRMYALTIRLTDLLNLWRQPQTA